MRKLFILAGDSPAALGEHRREEAAFKYNKDNAQSRVDSQNHHSPSSGTTQAPAGASTSGCFPGGVQTPALRGLTSPD